MSYPHPRRMLKHLFYMGVFCGLIQHAIFDAHAGESATGGAAAQQVVPPPDAPMPDAPMTGGGLPMIPPTMSVDEFTKHMEGAQEAALTLNGFAALKQSSPDVVVLDVRSKERFAGKYIKDSLNLPVTEMTEHTLPALIPDKTRAVVLVCDESFFPTRLLSMTLQAWPVLKANGYTNVYRLNLWRPEEEGGAAHTPDDIAQHVTIVETPPPAPPAGQ